MTAVETVETQMKFGVVYELFTDVNDMTYIGSTQGLIEKRLSKHKTASKDLAQTSKLYTAMREIGATHFFIRQLEVVEFEDDKDLVKREFAVMATRNKEFLYNMETVYGKMCDETRAKMSASQIGKIVSAETRAKIAIANKVRIVSAETRAKLSVASKGKTRSEECKLKMSAERQKGGSFSMYDDRNYVMYRYCKSGKQISKSFSYGPRSHRTKDQAMTLAKAYQRETFPDLFPVNDDE